nr:M13 family metallopeptidase N-terminal domain-containing protein [Clostridium taeniosporum]
MARFKKTGAIACILSCLLFMSQLTYVKAAEVKNTNNVIVQDNLRLQDDFYKAINKTWLNTAKIDPGYTSNSTFMEAYKTVTQQKKDIIKELLANEDSYPKDSDEKKIINLYKNVLNTEARNKQGTEAVKEMLDDIRNIKSLDDINDSEVGNILVPFSCEVDVKDVTKHALYIAATPLSLAYSDNYIKPTENTKRLKELTENYYTKILTLAGYNEKEAKVKVDNLFKFENMIAPSITRKEEITKDSNAIDKQYNVYTLDELDALAPNLDLKTMMKNLKIDNANKIILTQPKWLKTLNDTYNENNLQIIKDYIEIQDLNAVATFFRRRF